MADDQKKFLPISYVNRDFTGIRQDLLQMAERFYPDTFQDFSEASFGAMMIDAVAYVGDQVNFYLDYNINEAFLDTAYQYDNVLRHGRILGYKNSGASSTFGQCAFYVQIPSDSTGLGPDMSYIPILQRGTRLTSKSGLSFMLTENIDFNDPSNPIVVSQVDNTTGAPTYYAIKTYGNVVSGRLGQKKITVGPFERFRKVQIGNPNIVEIISVFDAEGNQYYEVDYLAQDMVYQEISNANFRNDNVPSILKPMLVSRKFVAEPTRNGFVLQFGSGDPADSDVVAAPQTVAIDVFGKKYVTDTSFDPTRLSKNSSYGIVPANTTLFITYRVANRTNSNVSVGGINRVVNPKVTFDDRTKLSEAKISHLISSFEASNETPITGQVSAPSTNEIKRRIYDTFPTQNRAVTQADYENIALRMPGKFGSVKKVTIIKDPDSLKRNLNLYVVSEDKFGKLVKTNATIKNNLKTWLNNYRMINDTIDILDPYIINIGIEFVAKLNAGQTKNTVLTNSKKAISNLFKDGFFISEPMYISSIYAELKKVPGILDVVSVKLINKSGGQYSGTTFNINKNMSQDGSFLVCPANAVFEIKYPETDIRGKLT